uniref:NADH-ubiquinone oxidoreductase chain 5 n=1 Tax=Allothyrus sp. LamingtonNP-QMS95173 TaxID=1442165 RepID=W0FI69_9ACAR|nr:NADH dehydrogenase subunit 5 [Allothyrus sp. LamingtonNP-QMS95173]
MFMWWSFILLLLSILMFFMGMFHLISMKVTIIEYMVISMFQYEVKLYFLFDWISLIFMAVVMFISSMVLFYSNGYMDTDKGKIKFCYIVLLFVLSMLLLIISPNLLMILLGWDGLGLISYCLVIYYQNVKSNSAGMITLLSNRIGDVCILLSILYMINFGSWDINLMMLSSNMLNLMGVLITLAAMTKSAQIPFSAWLPAAMAAPTPVSALVHSSTLVTAGVYLLIRFHMYFMMTNMSKILLYISILTMLMSGIGANLETDMKKVIALSTLSQLGLMMLILSLGMSNLAFFHLVTHAMFKAMLFLCAGVIIHGINGCQDIRMLGSISSFSPIVSGLMGLASISLAGFPFLSGFYSKDLILEYVYMLQGNLFIIFLLILAIIMTSIYSFRLMYYSLWKGLMDNSLLKYGSSVFMWLPILMMGMVVILFGSMIMWFIFPHPMFMILNFSSKMINLFILMVGLWLFYLIYFSNFQGNSHSSMISTFMGSMWFLPNLSGMLVIKLINSGYTNYLYYDYGWFEELGAQNFYIKSSKLSIIIQWIQNNSIKEMLFMILLVMMIMIF